MDQIPMKNQASRPNNPQSGSIFIWIFVMIALFGALSFAMMQSGRQGMSNLTSEKAKLLTTEILAQAETMGNTVRQLRINGCTDTQINFVGEPTTGWNYANTTSPPSYCSVFTPSAGALKWGKSPVDSATWQIMGIHCYEALGSTGTCSAITSELELNLIDIPDQLCIEINKAAGIGLPNAPPPLENYNANLGAPANLFRGTFQGSSSSTGRIENIGASGKRYGCYKDNTGSLIGSNIFFYILIAR